MKKPVYKDQEYQERFDTRYEELKWLYLELFREEKSLSQLFREMYRFYRMENGNEISAYAEMDMAFVSVMHEWAQKEPEYFLMSDEETIPRMFEEGGFHGNFPYYPENGCFVMAGLQTDQWSLNYRNPKVFREMVCRLLECAKKGTKVLRLKNLPYIWKELGTDCFDLPAVHKILRMLRLIIEVVQPEVEIWAVLDMSLNKGISYLGTKLWPECHRIQISGASDVIWHTLATRDVRLLRRYADVMQTFPEKDRIVRMLLDNEDFRWQLDYTALKEWGMEKAAHRKYLNDYYSGISKEKWSITSMCGWDKAVETGDTAWQEYALRRVFLLHAVLCILPGFPVWQMKEPEKLSGELSGKLQKLESIRKNEAVLGADASCRTMDAGENSILCVIRESEKEKLIGLFNFSEHEKMAWIDQQDGIYRDLLSGEYIRPSGVQMPGNGCCWLKKERNL